VSGYLISLVNLEAARCVVVGGGHVAARKVFSLFEAGAKPIVISPMVCNALQGLAERGEIDVIWRDYRRGDLRGARLAIAATDDPATNEAIWQEGQAAGCLVNVVDDPEHCDFFVPALVRRGALTIGISTGGTSPLLARRIREALQQQFDVAYEPYLALLAELRPVIQAQVADLTTRKALWAALLDSNILILLRAGQLEAAQQHAQEILESFLP
jgi:precorrin-2 dehydrogenase/sirohydrochlorin ferrochelatase